MENRTENFQPDCFQVPSVASTPPNGRALTQLSVPFFCFTIDCVEEA